MEYIVPVQPATFSVNPVTPTQKSADVVQHNLQPYQVVQATIADKGDGKVLLEMRGQQMWAQTNAEVKTGQQLNLQVTSTEPRLQLQIVPQGMEKHLLRLLHMFEQQPQFGTKLQQLSQALDAKSTQPQLQQLAHQFLGQRPPPFGAELAQAAQPLEEILSQLQTANQNVRAALGNYLQQIPAVLAQAGSRGETTATAQTFTQMTAILAEILLVPSTGTPTDTNRAAQLLAPMLQTASGQKPVATMLQQMHTFLEQLPSANLHAKILASDTGADHLSSQIQVLSAALIQALSQTIGAIQQQMATPPPRELALLAQVLGLNFEGRLLKGEGAAARNSLKGILLQLQNQEDVSAQVRGNSISLLQQLELYQLCRARLAEDGVLFLPLPFDFLHQGYALIEEHRHEKQDPAEKPEHRCLSVTLNLALEQLGIMNINMLFEQGNLFVRISCAKPETIALVEHTRHELNTCLKPFGLQRLNVDAGAQDPTVALLERLSPGKSMLSTQA
ncbi:MAG: hypothetical protein RBR06_02435 [Desulfuromonadaceae bacterium]|nr:hypothetical protein [Desulfuromonadaceae bacterium]